MIRETLGKYVPGSNQEFRHRGVEPGRLENFSDAVFALVITLLLISTSPPHNFDQIKRFVFELIPFSICITLIVIVWYQHYIFFYRYGLRHGRMIVLNTIFLIIVLFYVYPLKFLARLILVPISYMTGNEDLFNDLTGVIKPYDMADLMIIYGVGAAAVFFTLREMYRYALRNAEVLQLDEIEKFDTRVSMRSNLLLGIVPVFSVLVAIIFHDQWYAGMLSGFAYFLYTPIMMIYGRRVDRNRKKLLAIQPEPVRVEENSGEQQQAGAAELPA